MDELLSSAIIEIGDFRVKLYTIIQLVVFWGIIVFVVFIARKGIYRIKSIDIAKKSSILKLIQYFMLVLGIVYSLQLLGFNLSVVLAGSAALLVGLGLGMQNLFSDFVSGIILLVDGSLKVGDIIEVNDMICKVQEIRFRTTIVIGRDESYVILPNTDLTKNKVVNWTYDRVESRFKITVGVDYASDVPTVMRILQAAPKTHPKVSTEREPFVRFEDYGESSLVFEVFFWSNEVFRNENVKSDIRVEIYKQFQQNGITIPFPQRVVHTAQ